MKDLYSVLGVAKDADPSTIKKAFKTLARKWHPDVNKAPEAEPRFKEISAAYEVLGDEQKRALYDEFGEASLQSGFDADRARAFKNMGGFGGGPNGGGFPGFGGRGGGVDLGDLFGNLFTQGEGFGGRGGPRQGADIEGRVSIPFLDAVRGGEVPVGINRPAHCGACNGEGGTGKRACPTCQGRGRRRMGNFMIQCEECGGGGSVYATECGTCGGTGRVRDQRTINVRIPAGVDTGKVVRLRGQGGEGQAGGPPGDLLLTIEVHSHAWLRRNGRDLEMDLPITLAEALGGASIEVPTPTGRVRVKVPAGSGNGRRMRIGGKGVQDPHGAGDLYLILRPQLPPATGPEAVELARQLDALNPTDVRAELAL